MLSRSRSLFAVVIFTATISKIMVPAAWGDEGFISIELNRVSEAKGACRLSFVFTNNMDIAVEALSIETVLFNKKGSVERFLVMKSRPLSPKKIRVQQFDIRSVKCESMGRILLNDVKHCKVSTLTQQECLDRIKPNSRTDVPFVSTTVTN